MTAIDKRVSATVHELPEALIPWPPQRQGRPATVTSMPFPARAIAHEQAELRSAADRAVHAAWSKDVAQAERNGRDIGEQAGYRAGWYFGWLCGVVAGSLATAGGMLWMLG